MQSGTASESEYIPTEPVNESEKRKVLAEMYETAKGKKSPDEVASRRRIPAKEKSSSFNKTMMFLLGVLPGILMGAGITGAILASLLSCKKASADTNNLDLTTQHTRLFSPYSRK